MALKSMTIRGKEFTWSSPLVMAIINVTPDSFSDQKHCLTEADILAAAKVHIEAGADILDLGGYSTRPGADDVSPEEEWRRIQMAARVIRSRYPDAILSVDTFRAEVARKAVRECGVDIINDISGGQLDSDMFATVAELGAPYILTHTRGTPSTMASLTQYDDLMAEMMDYFREKTAALNALGFYDIILDPGFGFAKTLEQNYLLLSQLDQLHALHLPVLAGISHKSMIYKPLQVPAYDTISATAALHMVCLQKGAHILRAHETRETKQVISLYTLLQ